VQQEFRAAVTATPLRCASSGLVIEPHSRHVVSARSPARPHRRGDKGGFSGPLQHGVGRM